MTLKIIWTIGFIFIVLILGSNRILKEILKEDGYKIPEGGILELRTFFILQATEYWSIAIAIIKLL